MFNGIQIVSIASGQNNLNKKAKNITYNIIKFLRLVSCPRLNFPRNGPYNFGYFSHKQSYLAGVTLFTIFLKNKNKKFLLHFLRDMFLLDWLSHGGAQIPNLQNI